MTDGNFAGTFDHRNNESLLLNAMNLKKQLSDVNSGKVDFTRP